MMRATRNGTSSSTLLLDHPGWLRSAEGRVRRAFRLGEVACTVTCEPVSERFAPTVALVRPTDVVALRLDADGVDPTRLDVPAEFAAPLRARGRVHRVCNPDLWDALVTAVLHQRTDHARQRSTYQWLCETYGSRVPTEDGSALLLPTPSQMATLPSIAMVRLSMGPRRCSFPTVAATYLEHGTRWALLPPAQLVTELKTIPGVGPWTAGLAVADFTNDYSFLPFADFAISQWAANFLTTSTQPLEETEFARMWRRAHGQQLSMLTLLTLAWGVHHADGRPLWTDHNQQPLR